MHSFWPESWTFRHVKDVQDLWKKSKEYRDIVDEPIGLDTIKEKLDGKHVSQNFLFSYSYRPCRLIH